MENTATEMRVIYNLEKGEREIGQVLPHEKLLHLFEVLTITFRIYASTLSAATRPSREDMLCV